MAKKVCGPAANYEDVFFQDLSKCKNITKNTSLKYNCTFVPYGVCTRNNQNFAIPVSPANTCNNPEDCGAEKDWQCNPQDWFLDSTTEISSQNLHYADDEFTVSVAPAYEACCMSPDKSEIWTKDCFVHGSSHMCSYPPGLTPPPGSTGPPVWTPTPISEIASYLSAGVHEYDECLVKGKYQRCLSSNSNQTNDEQEKLEELIKKMEKMEKQVFNY